MSKDLSDPTLEEACVAKGMRMTDQRRIIAAVIEDSSDHPDVEELYRRASAIDGRISLSTAHP
jgi:Fur family ferric uptake transcriptional regulator